MMGWSVVIAAATAAVLAGPVAALTPDSQAASAQGANSQGVWRSRGYGYIVRIDAAGPKLFHAVDGACYADPRPRADPDGLLAVRRSVSPSTIAFSSGPADTAYLFDRLPALPKACLAKTDWTPRRVAAVAADTFAAFYPSSRERHIDWPARARIADKAAGKATSDAALFDVLDGLMAGLNDPHVGLQATLGGGERDIESGQAATLIRVRSESKEADPAASEKAWLQAYKRGVMDGVLKGRGHQTANNRVIWGRVGEIGYLNVAAMGGFDKDAAPGDPAALDKALDEALEAFAGAKAVIVDVSNNRGGYDDISLRIAGRFADRSRLAWTKVAVGARGVVPQAFHVEPARGRRYLGPVYLVTSDVTVSAGESFTLAMRALPNVVQVGERTRGALSDKLNKPLPNGWMLTLPGEIYRDPRGMRFEAVGIAPDVPRAVFAGDLAEGHARMIRALMTQIEQGGAPSPVTRS
jgi:carboxyl-terminal processing protease